MFLSYLTGFTVGVVCFYIYDFYYRELALAEERKAKRRHSPEGRKERDARLFSYTNNTEDAESAAHEYF